MIYGLDNHTFASIQQVISSVPGVDGALLYGSRARGDFKPYSDIDIAVYGDSLTLMHLAMLEERIDNLLLPYNCDICLLSQLRNEALIHNIQTEGKRIA